MKLSSINPMLSSQTSFNGLWGKEDSKKFSQSYYDTAKMCDVGTDYITVTKTYYPFKNETDEFIKSIVEENSTSESYSNNIYYDQSDCIIENEVKVMPKLDITEEEYNKYKNDDLLSKDENRVDDALKLAGLKQYLLRNIR